MGVAIADLVAPAANGNSSEIDVSQNTGKLSVYVTGTFVADLAVEVSPLKAGDVWIEESAAAAGTDRSVDITRPVARVRVVVSTYVSGTPVATVVYA